MTLLKTTNKDSVLKTEKKDTLPKKKKDTLPTKTGEGNGNPLQCSCLENPRDGGAWWAAVYGVA